LSPLARERFLPSVVFGPVYLCPLVRLALMRASDAAMTMVLLRFQGLEMIFQEKPTLIV
jgi:hypothetical protein